MLHAMSETGPKKADIVYFMGCNTSYYEYQALLNNMKIFTKAGVNFTTLGLDEWCCGTINLMTGQLKDFEKIAQHNLDAIKARKIELQTINEEVLGQADENDWSTDDSVTAEEVLKAIDELPKNYRVVVQLFLVEGYDHQEIS